MHNLSQQNHNNSTIFQEVSNKYPPMPLKTTQISLNKARFFQAKCHNFIKFRCKQREERKYCKKHREKRKREKTKQYKIEQQSPQKKL